MRFTIRDLMWLTVVVSMAAAWWVHYKLYEFWDHQGVLLDMQLRAAGWHVIYSDKELPVLIPPRDTTDQPISN